MIRVEVMVRRDEVEAVKVALLGIGIAGLSVCDVESDACDPGAVDGRRVDACARHLAARCKFEVVVRDDAAEKIRVALEELGAGGRLADTLVYEIPVAGAIRIRTGDRGDGAILF